MWKHNLNLNTSIRRCRICECEKKQWRSRPCQKTHYLSKVQTIKLFINEVTKTTTTNTKAHFIRRADPLWDNAEGTIPQAQAPLLASLLSHSLLIIVCYRNYHNDVLSLHNFIYPFNVIIIRLHRTALVGILFYRSYEYNLFDAMEMWCGIGC